MGSCLFVLLSFGTSYLVEVKIEIESFGYCLSVFLCFWTILFEMGLSFQHIYIENGCQSGWEKRCHQLYLKSLGILSFCFALFLDNSL